MKRKLNITDVFGFEDICDEFAITAGRIVSTCAGSYYTHGQPDPGSKGSSTEDSKDSRGDWTQGVHDQIESWAPVQNQKNTQY